MMSATDIAAAGMTARDFVLGHHLRLRYARETAKEAVYHGRTLAYGARGLHGMTRNARHGTIVGNWLYHSVGDRADAIRQLGIDYASFENDMMREIGGPFTRDNPESGHDAQKIAWWRANIVPVLTEWLEFQADELGSWWSRFGTDWSTIEAWHERLTMLRAAAHNAGFDIASGDPVALPTTAFDSAKSAALSLWGMIKMLIYMGAIFVGGFALWQVFKAVKGL